MPRTLLIASGCLIAAANAAAYDQGINYTLTLDAATGNTRVDYVITNALTSQAGQLLDASPFILASFNSLDAPVFASASVPTAGTLGWSGSLSGSRELYTLSAGLVVTATNLDTNATKNAVGFHLLDYGNGYLYLGFEFGTNPSNALPAVNGQHVKISGDTAGSFVINKSFSFFNQGQWIPDASYSNVIIGSAPAVPEPSTYGLALGGLALVGAVIRRRKISK